MALRVLVVNADLVVKNRVKTDIFEIGYVLHAAQIIAVALAQSQNSAARAEDLLPEVREGVGWGRIINDDDFGSLWATFGARRNSRLRDCKGKNGQKNESAATSHEGSQEGKGRAMPPRSSPGKRIPRS